MKRKHIVSVASVISLIVIYFIIINLNTDISVTKNQNANNGEVEIGAIRSLDKDFAKESEKVIFVHVSKLPINNFIHKFIIEDSTLFPILNPNSSRQDYGKAYNLYTGEEGSTIISKGRTFNETISSLPYSFNYDKNCILLYDQDVSTLISIDPKEIINNIPLGSRSVKRIKINIPSLKEGVDYYIDPYSPIIMDNNTIFGGLRNNVYPYKQLEFKYRYFIQEGDKAYKLGKFDDQLLSDKRTLDRYKSIPNLTRTCPTMQSDYKLSSYNNKIAVSVFNHLGFLLEVVDINKKSVVKSCCYGKEYLNNQYFCRAINTDENYIYVIAAEKECTNKEKGNYDFKNYKQFLLIYDWNLNPVKKITLENEIYSDNTYTYVVVPKDKMIFRFDRKINEDNSIEWNVNKSNFEV